MKHVAAILFAFLCACAGGTPTAYGQSAPMAPIRTMPRTWDSPATRDAPHDFRPGQPRPYVEPGPRPTRTLPQTPDTRKEAGIWATEPPTAAIPGSTPLPLLLDVLVPLPPGKNVDDVRPTYICAKEMDTAARKLMSKKEIKAMPNVIRRCLAAHLNHECTNRMVLALEQAERMGDSEIMGLLERWRKANAIARAFNAESCAGIPHDPDRHGLTLRIVGEFDRAMRARQVTQ